MARRQLAYLMASDIHPFEGFHDSLSLDGTMTLFNPKQHNHAPRT
jgi:hypothetical protein